ncbi:MAG TPA: GNAT family N-acetyltransferase [Actinospica sp.]|nr:GNAT family N-acetyltransferase [Actinospica sp.]
MTTIDRADAYALLTDGRAVRLRSATPADWRAVHDFAGTLGPDSVYRRFFGSPRDPGAILADLVCKPQPEHGPPTHGGLLAVLDGEIVGLADWYRSGSAKPDEAEMAFAVSDALHGRGVATLLAEHLMIAAERARIRLLHAVTQGDNRDMLGVFIALGVPVRRDWSDGVCTLTIDLELDSAARATLMEAAAKREGLADEASLRSLLAPGSIAVIGDVAHLATRRLMDELAAFSGPVYYGGVEGADLPDDARPELAVVTSPPDRAVVAAARCAERGVRALIVTATGFDREQGLELLTTCRANGIRLVGPGSLGVAAPHGADGFSALLSATAPDPGPAGVAVQSGGVGLALLSHLDRLGIGVSTFAAVGEKYDVSANDLLLHWEQDSDTKLGLLHVESFGNPRKFAHTARRLSRLIPLLAVDPEQSLSQARTALYAQAGIIAVPSLGALIHAAALTAHQPLPTGRRVAVLGNTHGMVSLAVQACLHSGFEVTHAVDATPAADAAKLVAHITHIFEDPSAGETDLPESVLLALAPATPELTNLDAVMDAVPATIPILAVLAEQPESVAVRRCGARHEHLLPCYNDAAAAAEALTAARRAARVKKQSPARIEYPDGIDLAAVRGVLKHEGESRELLPSENDDLLRALGIPVGGTARLGPDAREASVTAWQDKVFGPVLFGLSDEWRQPVTMLAPVDAGTAESVAARIAGEPAPPLADLYRRVAALVDACPEVASFRLDVEFDMSGIRRGDVVTLLAPAESQNPHLRRLRRAPVE